MARPGLRPADAHQQCIREVPHLLAGIRLAILFGFPRNSRASASLHLAQLLWGHFSRRFSSAANSARSASTSGDRSAGGAIVQAVAVVEVIGGLPRLEVGQRVERGQPSAPRKKSPPIRWISGEV